VVATLEMNQPLELEPLLVQCNLSADEARRVVDELTEQGKVVAVGRGAHRLLYTSSGWDRLAKKAETVVQDYHRRFPTRAGMPKGELSSRLRLAPHSAALGKLFDDGILVEEGVAVRLPSHRIQLTQDQQAKVDAFLLALSQNPYSPSAEVTVEPELLNLLIGQNKVVKVGGGVVFSASAYQEMVDKVIAFLRERGRVTLAEVRDMLGTGRKHATALLEHMDEKKLTRRVGDERVLR